MIGSKFGPYELLEEIGRGGMATVYRAYQPNVDRYVAVKVIHRSVAMDSKSLDRFTREARLIARLEHPHILPVYDYDGLHDPPYIVMRYLPSGTLKDILQREQLPYSEVVYLMGQVASALDYAHRQGVVHRDIKPSNIMVDADGNAFLTDFGIARLVEGTMDGLTGTGMAIGTPGYMSPEQGLGEPIDGRSDIYALGVMLFEMLVGKVPYSAETPMAIILKHINDPVPEATSVKADLPPAVNHILQKAMAKDPKDRYASALDLIRSLTVALDVTPTGTPSRLQAVASQTMVDLQRLREEASQSTPLPGVRSGRTPLPVSTSQVMPRTAVQGALVGAGGVILLLLLLGGVLLLISNKNSSDQTATFIAQVQTDYANRTQAAVNATLTATFRPNATFTATQVPPTSVPVVVLPSATRTNTLVPPTATATIAPSLTATQVPPTHTLTAIPPTSLPVIAPTKPPTATNTALPPTFTSTSVPPTATNTLVPTHTNTPIPPTATLLPTLTFTPIPTQTFTSIPPTPIPPPTLIPTVPPTAVPVPTQSAVVPTSQSVSPQVALVSGKLPYVNDMEALTSLDGWDYDPNSWRLQTESGNVALIGSGDFKSPAVVMATKSPEWTSEDATNLLLSLSMNLDTVSSIGRVIFRNSANGYYVLEMGVGRAVIKRGKTKDVTRIGDERVVAQVVNTTIRNGTWYGLEIWSEANRLNVYLDHRLILLAEDSTAPLPGGTLLLQSFNKNFRVRFDNLKVQRPLPASNHFQGSNWPASWDRTGTTTAKIASDPRGNNFVDLTSGDVRPQNPPITDLRMSCRIWVVQGGFDLRVRESSNGVYLFHFDAGDLVLSQIDGTGKVIQKWTRPNFYGRADFFDLGIETIGDQIHVFTARDEFAQTVKNAPPAGTVRFTANAGDELRLDDCLFAEAALSPTEDASWAFDKIAEIEARPPQFLIDSWPDRFDDQFKTKDWWEGGINAPGTFKVNSADAKHPTYLELSYKEGASWRIFRNVKEFYVFGLGQNTSTFYDSSDIYLKVTVRVPNPGTAWVAARTTVSTGRGTLNGYRIELTRNPDGSYSVVAREYSLGGTPIYFQGSLPQEPGTATPDWVPLLIISYHNKVAFFANGRLLGSTSSADILDGTVALGVNQGTVANFDEMQLRDASPETR